MSSQYYNAHARHISELQSSMSSPTSSPYTPQRMSLMYQYHNAPEVAPVAGLEHDSTTHPYSDKYPVAHTYPAKSPRADGFQRRRGPYFVDSNMRPPLIIFGMKPRVFFVVATVVVCVIIGAAVGGAVGGKNLQQTASYSAPAATSAASQTATRAANDNTTPTLSAPTSTFSSTLPTYTALTDCPSSNNTLYTSAFESGTSGTVSASAGLNFTKRCDLSNPLAAIDLDAKIISEAFVYTFNDCIEVCASYNFWSRSADCSLAVYQTGGGRPGNCWVGSSNMTITAGLGSMPVSQGTDVAILQQNST